MADIIFGKQKSFGAKPGVQGGCSISATDFWARNYLTESVLLVVALSNQRAKFQAFSMYTFT
jgi:hypothetical protein